MITVNLGDKFYKIAEDDSLEIIRITRIKNENSFIATYENGKSTIAIDRDFLNIYTRLKADAYISFAVVKLQGDFKDVIITMNRRSDIEKGINVPYCICRQSVLDIFANQVRKTSAQYIGVSISKDTCPPDIDFNIMLACESLDYMVQVSSYIDDTMDDILSLVPKKKFDECLSRYYNIIDNVLGSCNSLNQLVTENFFHYDFLKAFDIYPVTFKIDNVFGHNELPIEQIKIVEDILKVQILRSYIYKYDKEIDLSKIERDYILLSDVFNDLYVLGFDKGEHVNHYYDDNSVSRDEEMVLRKYTK